MGAAARDRRRRRLLVLNPADERLACATTARPCTSTHRPACASRAECARTLSHGGRAATATARLLRLARHAALRRMPVAELTGQTGRSLSSATDSDSSVSTAARAGRRTGSPTRSTSSASRPRWRWGSTSARCERCRWRTCRRSVSTTSSASGARAGSGQPFAFAVTVVRDRATTTTTSSHTERSLATTRQAASFDLVATRIVRARGCGRALRRAFRNCANPPARNPESIHGDVRPKRRMASGEALASRWLATTDEVDKVASRFFGVHRIDRRGDQPWARDRPALRIERAVENPYFVHAELSELLANAGVLPMFGFPTRVRALYAGSRSYRQATGGGDRRRPPTRPGNRQARLVPSLSRTGVNTPVLGFRRLRRVRRHDAVAVDPVGQGVQVGSVHGLPVHRDPRRAGGCGNLRGVWNTDHRVARRAGPRASGASTGPPTMTMSENSLYGGGTQLAAHQEATIQPLQVQGCTLSVIEQAVVVQVNDNLGALFPMVRLADRSVAVTDASLYPNPLPGWLADPEPYCHRPRLVRCAGLTSSFSTLTTWNSSTPRHPHRTRLAPGRSARALVARSRPQAGMQGRARHRRVGTRGRPPSRSRITESSPIGYSSPTPSTTVPASLSNSGARDPVRGDHRLRTSSAHSADATDRPTSTSAPRAAPGVWGATTIGNCTGPSTGASRSTCST